MGAKTEVRYCTTCGAQLASSGECTACLLQLGISGVAVTSDSNHPGDLPTIKELNEQFPQLEISRLIGHGGMGAIYHARQKALDRDVALKLISKSVSTDAAFVERFEREAKTLAKLSHPNVVGIYDYGHTEDGVAYLVMEYVDGINLRDAISSGGMGSEEALRIVSTICKALAYAHSKGVVHRDIKPENILLGEDGALKVADFGIAKILDDSVRTPTLTATRQVLGSLHYLAPEHLESPKEVDHRVDLYALGVIFYELLTGQLPLGRFEAPSAVQPLVDPRLDPVVLKTLSRKPRERYQHAHELETDVNGLLAESSQSVSANHDAASAPVKAIAVPFTCEAMSGFAEAVGIIHVRDRVLFAEFRIRDVFGGSVKSKTHTVEIPRENITNLEFVSGMFGSKIVITADTIAALGAFPEAETGRAQLKIKRTDEPLAKALVHAMGFGSVESTLRAPMIDTSSEDPSNRVVFAALMLLCGFLNGGGLAISEAVIARELSGEIAGVAGAVGVAVSLGPIAIVQLLAGIFNLFARPRSLNIAASVVSMVPLTPVWLLSFPTGIWAYRWMTSDEQPLKTREDSRVGWGTTTLMFLGESRWSRAIGSLNALAAIAVVSGVLVYAFGYYPTKLTYRVVDTDVSAEALSDALRARLEALEGTQRIDFNSETRPTRITVKTLRGHTERTEQALRLPQAPTLIWLQRADSDASNGAADPIAVNSQLKVSRVRTESSPVGQHAFPLGTPVVLRGAHVKAVSKRSPNELVIELTLTGRKELESSAASDETAALGLVIDGLVEGIATSDGITPQQILFHLSDASEFNADCIAAAIRGPEMPTHLELLE